VPILEDEGLILRSLRYGDTSRIVTLLTKRYGKIHGIAKGARDMKSPFSGALEVLTRVEVTFYFKKSRTLHFLKAAAAERAFLAILSSPPAFCLASAALEFVDRVLPDEDPCGAVYAGLLRFLEGTESAPENPRGEIRLKAFQLHTVCLLGYAPQLDHCTRCGGPAVPNAGFGVSEGGLVCRRCRGEGRILPLSPEALRALRVIVESAATLADRPPAATDRAVSAADRELEAVAEAFLRYHVTGYRGLRSLRSLTEWRGISPQT